MSNNYIEIGIAVGVLILIILFCYVFLFNKSITSLGDTQLEIANINKQVSTISTNINTLIQNQANLMRNQTAFNENQINLMQNQTTFNENQTNLMQNQAISNQALDKFIIDSNKYYTQNQLSIKAINDVISSLNTYTTSNLFTKSDLSELIGNVNNILRLPHPSTLVRSTNNQIINNPPPPKQIINNIEYDIVKGTFGNRGMFSATDSAEQIAATVGAIKQQLINQTAEYLQTSQQFASAIQNQISLNIGASSLQPAVANAINALISSGKLNIKSSNINDFNTAVNNVIASSTTQQQLTASQAQLVQTQAQLTATQAQLTQLTNTVGNYINALQGGTITISATDIAKLYTALPNNQTYFGNNIGGQCGTYTDLYSAYAACNVNNACVGFTTITVPGVSGTSTQVPACLKTSLSGGIQTTTPTTGISEAGGSYRATGSLYQTYIKNALAPYSIDSNSDYLTTQTLSSYPDNSTSTIMDAVNACNDNASCVGFTAQQNSQGNWMPKKVRGGSLYSKTPLTTGDSLFFSKVPFTTANCPLDCTLAQKQMIDYYNTQGEFKGKYTMGTPTRVNRVNSTQCDAIYTFTPVPGAGIGLFPGVDKRRFTFGGTNCNWGVQSMGSAGSGITL